MLTIPRKYAQKLYPHLTFYEKAEAAKHIMDKEARCHLDVYPYEIIPVSYTHLNANRVLIYYFLG